ncbi:MAG: AAA family ATPase [Candidatus Nanopelagicales bacterium]
MKIHTLRFAALGPFAGEEVIDFDALGSSALFLIDGPTGAGKSTVIDAIVFALFGDVAGEASDKERLRSAFASPEVESFAELDFTTDAGRFLVRRTPAYERAKKRGTGTTAESATVHVWRSVGEHTWEPLSGRHAEADAEIIRAVGLSRTQFLQTVVLPQGEFATFLRSESADRLPILERIFATEVYSRIQSAFDEDRRTALRAREQALLDLSSARDVLRGQLEGSAFSIESEHDPTTWSEQRAILMAQVRGQSESAAAATVKAEELLAETTARMDALVAAEEASKAEALARTRLGQADSRVDDLQAALDFSGDATTLDESLSRHEAEIEACAADAAIEAGLPALEQQATVAGLRIEELTQSIGELEHDRDAVIPARMAAFVAGLREEVSSAERAVGDQEQHVSELRTARIRGLSGEIALDLADGHPCPVCGSLEHPEPAVLHPDHVSVALVEEGEAELATTRAQLDSLRTRVAVIEVSIPTIEVTAEPAHESRASMIEALELDIEVLAGIGARIDEFRSQITSAESSLCDLEARIAVDLKTVMHARGEYDSVARRAEAARARREALIELREARALQEQARVQLESLIEGSVERSPDEAELATARLAREEAGAAARHAASASTAAARLLGVVGTLCSKVDAAQEAYETVVRDSAATIRLAQALTGTGGQSLSAYVVQRAFDEVVEAANARLSAMLGGHFRLVTTQERTGTRRTGLGLGLKVRDLRTDTERRTSTLSGGESFCASLALALGLADSVRAHAGGVEIGMLFIDEGFGALDAERLGDVMAELLRLRADGRTVGVISHVSEMKRAIPERVDVMPGAAGSTLSVRWMA